MTTPSEIYQHAQYYEIATSFVDVHRQVDLLEAHLSAHSSIPAASVLDLCCGPSPQLREFARRGYRAVGVDASAPMLAYLQDQAAQEQVKVETVGADIRSFSLDRPVDFAYILMGSIPYVGDREGLLANLLCVAQALRPGGLYLIENLQMNWVGAATPIRQDWTLARDGITVASRYELEVTDPLAQMARHFLEFDVDDHGRRVVLQEECQVTLCFPQEFRALVDLQGQFEFVGFFERDGLEPLRRLSWDNMVVLRRHDGEEKP